MKFWLCSTNATNATQLDLDLLKHLEEAKIKVRDPETIKMVETVYVKLKDHLWYLSERLVQLALLSAKVVSIVTKRKRQMQFLNIRTKPVQIANKCLKQKILEQNFSKILLGRTHGPFLNCCMKRNRHSYRREFESGQLKNHTCR